MKMNGLYSIAELAFIGMAVLFLLGDMFGLGNHPEPLTVVIICLLWANWLALNRVRLQKGKP